MSNTQNTKGSILSFGELLLRICPDGDGQWLAENKLPFFIGGAELNVANALALWDLPARYFTAVPENELTAQILNFLEEKRIDTSAVYRHGNRIGLYYLTRGKDLKHSAVVYDRAGSAFADLKPGMVDWDKVLDGVSWFHFSAICPALSQQAADVCQEVLQAACRKHITISVDLNYRPKLWQYGKKPVEIMPQLVQHADIIMGNVWAAETMLGIEVTPEMHESGQQSIYLKEALFSSERIMDAYPRCRAVANTFRFDAGAGIEYYTALYTGNRFYHSATYTTDTVVDKVGSGDCFMAGLIYGFYQKHDPQQLLDFATAAAWGKLSILGDATTQTVDEVYNTMK